MSRSSRSRPARPLALALAVLAGTSSAAQNFELDPEPVRPRDIREIEAWQDKAAVPLPPWPLDRDLVEWQPEGPPTPFRFFIDSAHLDVDGAGAVVRYTLVAESQSGTRNVSYEGIRCTLRGAYRVYAYGSGQRLVRAPTLDWQPLPTKGSEAYRADLWRNRFCVPRESRPLPRKDILRALKNRATPDEDTGLHAD